MKEKEKKNKIIGGREIIGEDDKGKGGKEP